MNSTSSNMSEIHYLMHLLQGLFKDDSYNICIQDTSGVLHSIPWLHLDYQHRVHTGPICTTVKQTTRGLNCCSRMKTVSLSRFKPSDKAFISRCHLGLYEAAMPVFYRNKLACAVYIGSFIPEGYRDQALKQAKKYAGHFGIPYEELAGAIEATREINTAAMAEILKLAESIAFIICLIIEKSGSTLAETSKKNRLNKCTTEGIHWAAAFAMEYVDMYYNRDIQLRSIARMVFLNPDYLSRLFTKETGRNFVDYLNERRISEAGRMILQSKASITDVCYDVGFNSKPHFNRMFKRIYNVTPMEYKKAHRKDKEAVKHNPSRL